MEGLGSIKQRVHAHHHFSVAASPRASSPLPRPRHIVDANVPISLCPLDDEALSVVFLTEEAFR